jgi:hypothetical protein
MFKTRPALFLSYSEAACHTFIKAYINYITKVEFFLAFTAAYKESMTAQNCQAGFRRAGLVPFDPQAVLSKLDVKLRTPTPSRPSSANTSPWVS